MYAKSLGFKKLNKIKKITTYIKLSNLSRKEDKEMALKFIFHYRLSQKKMINNLCLL
jgi:hypothetical protein